MQPAYKNLGLRQDPESFTAVPAAEPSIHPRNLHMSHREKPSNHPDLSAEDQNRIVRMAWEDRTSFDAIQRQFGLSNGQVIALMRRVLQPSAFVRWRKRTAGRQTKHDQLRGYEFGRFRSPGQRGD